jgi:hypothetical protein
MVAAAAGAASAIPGLMSVFDAAQTEAPAVDTGAADVAAGATDAGIGIADSAGPVVAHVRDLSTGEVALFNGTREVVVRDPQLANNLVRAAR